MGEDVPLLRSLAMDEFVVLQDNMCHLGTEADRQMTLTPAMLVLTNRHAVISAQSPQSERAFIRLSDITSLYEETLYDCHVLTIKLTGLQSVHVFMPIESTQTCFFRLVSNLITAFSQDQYAGDSVALSYRSIFLQSRTLPEFYQLAFENSDRILTDPIPLHEFFTPQVTSFIANLFETSALLFLCIVIFLACLLTFILWIIPFGVLFFGGIAIFIILVGIQLALERDTIDASEKRLDVKLARRFRHVLPVYEEFRSTFSDRFLWENPRSTLETLMFVLASGLLFSSFSSATIVTLSLLGIAIVERWNPFGFGSPLDLLLGLFQF
jgi:hypothetical protein